MIQNKNETQKEILQTIKDVLSDKINISDGEFFLDNLSKKLSNNKTKKPINLIGNILLKYNISNLVRFSSIFIYKNGSLKNLQSIGKKSLLNILETDLNSFSYDKTETGNFKISNIEINKINFKIYHFVFDIDENRYIFSSISSSKYTNFDKFKKQSNELNNLFLQFKFTTFYFDYKKNIINKILHFYQNYNSFFLLEFKNTNLFSNSNKKLTSLNLLTEIKNKFQKKDKIFQITEKKFFILSNYLIDDNIKANNDIIINGIFTNYNITQKELHSIKTNELQNILKKLFL